MNKADRERLARRQRMLAREQGQAPEAGIRGTSGDISLRTPKPVHRGAPPPKTPDPQAAQTAARLKSLTPLYKQRQHQRRVFFAVAAAVLALAFVVLTGALSASLAMLGDAVDSAMLYLNRTDGGWPANTGITEPRQIEPLAGGFVELGDEDVLVYSPYGSRILSLQPSYARPVLAVGGTHFVVYNRAGSELTVCSRTRTLYSQTFDEGILLCAMSNNNSLAVVTESGRFAAQVRIFDTSMRQLYSWAMPQTYGTPIALDFSPDSRRFAAGMLSARDGQLSCSVYFMNTDTDGEGPSYTADLGSMLLRLDWQSESRVMAVFDSYPKLMDLYNFIDYDSQDFESWYVDLRHRIRHGGAKALTLRMDGMILASGILSSVTDKGAVLTAVRTQPEFRRMGYGSMLVRRLVADCKGTVYLMREQGRNEQFYLQNGFINQGLWRQYQ